MDRYATHLEALVSALMQSDGPVLELGCGDYSTPVIAAMCGHWAERPFLVQASDESWAARYRDIAEVQIVDWKKWTPPAPPGGLRWSVVLLDSEESTAGRIEHLPKLRDCAQVVLLHDADAAMTRKRWKQCTEGYRIRLVQRFKPWTAVLEPC